MRSSHEGSGLAVGRSGQSLDGETNGPGSGHWLECIKLSNIRKTLKTIDMTGDSVGSCSRDITYSNGFPVLDTAYLSDNDLVTLFHFLHVAPNLVFLDVSYNNLIRMPDMSALIPGITLISLEGNSIMCDCGT